MDDEFCGRPQTCWPGFCAP